MGISLNDWDSSAVGLGEWIAWSRTSKKHVEGECERKWNSFTPGGKRTWRSLFKTAVKNGWKPKPGISLKSKKKSNSSGKGQSVDDPIFNSRGNWVSCLFNSKLLLKSGKHAKVIRYDRFRQLVLVDGKPLTDELVISLTDKIEADTRGAWSQDHVRSALVDIAHQDEFSSLTEYLDGLQWDGVDRIDKFFPDCFDSEETDYSGACARVFFLSAVARAYQPGCQADVMVVLIGKQGIGKSVGFTALCENPEWFADDLGCDLCAAKAGEGLQGKWIFEFSEFARINRSTLDMVKAFISRRVDRYRPPWGRIAKDFPRSCVFIGTTNDRQPLHDSENRRFMPLRVGQGNRGQIEANRVQYWAEAVARYRAGENWWISSSHLLQECSSHQQNARLGDAWEAILQDKLAGINKTTMVQAAEMLGLWDDRPGWMVNRLGKSEQTRIGLVLTELGFERKREPLPPRSYFYEREAGGTV